MSDTQAEPRIGYRVEVTPYISGKVKIEVYQYAREGEPGWFATKREAFADAADRMQRLAQELQIEAGFLMRDERGR